MTLQNLELSVSPSRATVHLLMHISSRRTFHSDSKMYSQLSGCPSRSAQPTVRAEPTVRAQPTVRCKMSRSPLSQSSQRLYIMTRTSKALCYTIICTAKSSNFVTGSKFLHPSSEFLWPSSKLILKDIKKFKNALSFKKFSLLILLLHKIIEFMDWKSASKIIQKFEDVRFLELICVPPTFDIACKANAC